MKKSTQSPPAALIGTEQRPIKEILRNSLGGHELNQSSSARLCLVHYQPAYQNNFGGNNHIGGDFAVMRHGWRSLLEKLGYRSVVDLMNPRRLWRSSCTKENRESKWMVYRLKISWDADISSSGLPIYRWKEH
jgi:hypothetical protein